MSALTDALAGMDLTWDLPDGELVSDAIVIVRMVNGESGEESFGLADTAGMSWFVQLGLINAAHHVITHEQNGEDDQ